ncbi:MAG: nucleotidyltransferase [Flavobacteriia bacterium]|nr:MAG: nucleotidyltransferase [Flavobacteriia bacterium]
MKAMILAAGLGTRLKPFTEQHPKALLPINNKTLLQRNIEYVKQAGITEIVINIHHFGQQIIDFLNTHNNFGCHIQISDEREELLETGGGLLKARHLLEDSPFVLLNADILTHLDLSKMIAYHNQCKPLVTLAVSQRISSRQLEFNQNMSLCGWKNLNTGEHIHTGSQVAYERAFSGIHIIDPALFERITETGKFSIIPTYLRLMEEYDLKGFDHTGIEVLDVGKPENIDRAERYFK